MVGCTHPTSFVHATRAESCYPRGNMLPARNKARHAPPRDRRAAQRTGGAPRLIGTPLA